MKDSTLLFHVSIRPSHDINSVLEVSQKHSRASASLLKGDLALLKDILKGSLVDGALSSLLLSNPKEPTLVFDAPALGQSVLFTFVNSNIRLIITSSPHPSSALSLYPGRRTELFWVANILSEVREGACTCYERKQQMTTHIARLVTVWLTYAQFEKGTNWFPLQSSPSITISLGDSYMQTMPLLCLVLSLRTANGGKKVEKFLWQLRNKKNIFSKCHLGAFST